MHKTYIILALLQVIGIFQVTEANAESTLKSDCRTHADSVNWKSCIYSTVGSQSQDVVIYFHGIGKNEKDWANKNDLSAVRSHWELSGTEAPRVATISFGTSWLLAEKNTKAKSGLLEFFVNNVMPELEKELGGIKGRRILFGLSMGGFNAAQVMLKQPGLFDRVVLACPAFTNVSPFAPSSEIDAYIKRTHADRIRVAIGIEVAKAHFDKEASWKTADPVYLAKTLIDDRTPDVLIHIGDDDQYGFHEGAELFADIAKSRSTKHSVEWELMDGGHCTFDAAKVADFIVR